MKKHKLRWLLGSAILLSLLFYFLFLLHQVQVAFEAPAEFIPTRIYSDVSRVVPGQARQPIEKKLKSLGYTAQVKNDTLSFVLHSPKYPEHLLPENHPTLQLMDKPITLHFDGTKDESLLEKVESGSESVNEFYLEPELVAALTSEKSQIREVLKFDEFPKAIPDAIVAAEDQHFYEHFGIDPRGFARALWVNLKTLSFSQGGSTITQQLVKNLMERKNRNLFMKINELFLAPVLEFKYTKKQIFERYLNEVFLGQIGSYEIRGFSEGAKYFYGKQVNDLNMAEIALLVGLIKGPAFYSPYNHLERAQTRQRYVLERMFDTKKITEAQLKTALQLPVRLAPPPQAGNRAPYFVDYVKAEITRLLVDQFPAEEIPELGFQVYTSLDLNMNQIAQETLQAAFPPGPTKNAALQGAIAIVDQSTSQIRALIGGKNYADSNFNRILNMKRQVGSTFKPIVYASAFRAAYGDGDGNAFTPAYPLLDQQWSWKYDPKQPLWKPSNYEKKYLGWIPLKTALAKSVNTAAARVAKKIGLPEVAETARSLGIETKIPLVPSVSLGSVELSPLEVITAYAILANHGKADELSVIKSILNPDGSEFFAEDSRSKQRIDPGIADMMTELLQEVFVDGTASSAGVYGFKRPAAGKTGTTNDYRDAWFVGYTPHLTAVVWVGFDQGTQKFKLTGTTVALPIWAKMMARILKYEPEIPFPESEHLIDMRLDKLTGQKADSSCSESQVVLEKVIVGREPKKSTCAKEYPKEETNTVK